MSRRPLSIRSPPHQPAMLEKSADGLFYVEDAEDGMYEIEAFLGDVAPICQVFRAKYYPTENTTVKFDRLDGVQRRKGRKFHQVVALKLARVDGSPEFMNLRREVDNSFKIGLYDVQENNVINDHTFIVGIYKSFYCSNFLCISMPYFEGGSLRYIISKNIPDRNLPENCIAMVLREVLKGLCILHRQEKVHRNLNAGNIFVGNFHRPYQGPVTIKLGHQGSTYFHNPEADRRIRIWDNSWNTRLGGLPLCAASGLDENLFWTTRGIYEPRSISQQQNYTIKSDIWNLGVTAIELAMGQFRSYRRHMSNPLRNEDEFRTFLTNLCNSEETRLPTLFRLFLPDSGSRTEKGESSKNLEEKILSPKPQEAEPKLPEIIVIEDDGFSSLFTAMVKKCLAYEPNERPTAEELLNDPFFEKHKDADLQYFKQFLLIRRAKPTTRNF